MLKQAGNSNMAAAALIQPVHQSSRPYVDQECFKSGSLTLNEIKYDFLTAYHKHNHYVHVPELFKFYFVVCHITLILST